MIESGGVFVRVKLYITRYLIKVRPAGWFVAAKTKSAQF